MRLRVVALLPLLLVGSQLAHPARASSPLMGPDTAQYQHPNGRAIDWNAVRRSGQTFAFIKATGTRGTDPWFTRDWAGAGRAGLIRAAYHYADPRRSADAQAAQVVAAVGSTREANDLGIVLDLEENGGLNPQQLRRWAHAFLDDVERRTGRVPILYTYPVFWRDRMKNDTSFGKYPLWLARYSSSAPAPLPGWNRWTFWQHTDNYRINGIPAVVDHDVMCCSLGTLLALADGRSLAITRMWSALGGASGQLGLPLGPEVAVSGGWGETFEKGFISTTPQGTWAVLGDFFKRYEAAGGAAGPLGAPIGSRQTIAAGVDEQLFAGGRIIWSQLTGAHALYGLPLVRWLADGGLASPEGLPIGDLTNVTQQFLGGGLYVTPSGVHLVPGLIRDRYEQLGGASSALGLPTDEAHPGTGGTVVDFQNGNLTQIDQGGQSIVI